jgi:hypothetical protein
MEPLAPGEGVAGVHGLSQRRFEQKIGWMLIFLSAAVRRS